VPRGGILGQAELWVATGLFSKLGADILALFLFVAAVILISRATVAELVRAMLVGGLRAARTLNLPVRAAWQTVAPCPANDRATPIGASEVTALADSTLNGPGEAPEVTVTPEPAPNGEAESPHPSTLDDQRSDLNGQAPDADWPGRRRSRGCCWRRSVTSGSMQR